MSAQVTEGAVVTAADGRITSLPEFLADLTHRSEKPISAIAEDAGLSRAAFYLIRDKGQQPALLTLASLLTALGAVVQVPERLEQPDLQVTVDGATFLVEMKESTGELHRERRALRGLLAATRPSGPRTPATPAPPTGVHLEAAPAGANIVETPPPADRVRARLYHQIRQRLDDLDDDGVHAIAAFAQKLATASPGRDDADSS